MSISKITRHFLALSVFAALGTSCGNVDLLPLASSIHQANDLFSTLAEDSSQDAPAEMQDRIAQFKAEHPELAAQLEALKELSPEERRAKVQELRESNPELAQQFRTGHKMGFGRKGHPMMPGHMRGRPSFASEKPDFAAFKDLSPEERQAKIEELKANFAEAHPEHAAKMEEMKARFAEDHPEWAARIEEFKALSPEERQAKIEEYRAEHAQHVAEFKDGPAHPGMHMGMHRKAFASRRIMPGPKHGHFQGKYKHFAREHNKPTEQAES